MKNQNIYVYVFVSISQSYGSRLWSYGYVIVVLCGSLWLSVWLWWCKLWCCGCGVRIV